MPDPDPDPDTRTPQVPAGPRFITTVLTSLTEIRTCSRLCRLWRRTVASRRVTRQPTDANLYAPSLNEAFEDDSHSRKLQMFIFLFHSHLSLRNGLACRPEAETITTWNSLCTTGIFIS